MQSLSQRRKKIYTVTLPDAETTDRFVQESGLNLRERNGNCVQLVVKNQIPETLRVLAKYEPVDLDIKTQSLEELFMHFYGEEEAK